MVKLNRYVTYNTNEILKLNKDLSLNNAGAIMKMLPHLSSDNSLMMIDVKLEKSDIQYLIDRNVKTTREILRKLISLDILSVVKGDRCNYIRFNDMMHTTSNTKTSKYKLNINTIRNIGDELKLNELGLLYKILPYVNLNDYSLVNEAGESINRNELAALLNIKPYTINILTKKLIDNDVMIVKKNGRCVSYFLNKILFEI